MKWLKRVLVALAVLALAGAGLLQWMNSRTFQFFGGLTNRVTTDQKLVALTFDDGPTQRVEPLLALLREKDVRATFFLVGAEIEKSPQLARDIVQAGHQVGNHSWSHKRMVFITPAFARAEIEKTDAAIRNTGYVDNIAFRPPYGKKLLVLPWVLRQQGKRSITWDVEPETDDKTAQSSQLIAQAVLAQAKPGSIILLHPMYSDKALDALPAVIDGLRQQGYQFVTVDGLLAAADTPKSGV